MRMKQLGLENVFLAGPNSLDLSFYRKLWPQLLAERFADKYFSNIGAYNTLMLAPEFYERFQSTSKWLLLHQLDAFMLENKVDEFCAMPYDYFGAPWRDGQLVAPLVKGPIATKLFGTKVDVGNGGLSLRNISATISLLDRRSIARKIWRMNEDAFFAYYGLKDRYFRASTAEISSRFALETDPEYWIRRNGCNPMGIHGFEKHSPKFYGRLLGSRFDKVAEFISTALK